MSAPALKGERADLLQRSFSSKKIRKFCNSDRRAARSSKKHFAVRLVICKAGLNEVEFRKLVDHRGIVLYFPLTALVHPGLARAHTPSGGTDNARIA